MNRFANNRFVPSLAKIKFNRSFSSMSPEARSQFYATYIPNKIVEKLHSELHTEFRKEEASYEINSMQHGYKCDVILKVGGKTINYQVNRPYDKPDEIKKRDDFLISKNIKVSRPDISMFDERLLDYMDKV